jgi:hypothetical protein
MLTAIWVYWLCNENHINKINKTPCCTEITAFWDVMPCSLLHMHQQFGNIQFSIFRRSKNMGKSGHKTMTHLP